VAQDRSHHEPPTEDDDARLIEPRRQKEKILGDVRALADALAKVLKRINPN
jgi:hypothetical protein